MTTGEGGMLLIDDEEFNLMRENVLAYYKQNSSPFAFLTNFQSLKFPSTLYMNVDGHTLDSRRERLGLPRLFPLPKNWTNQFLIKEDVLW